MESNEQNELTSKTETDSQIESRLTVVRVGGSEGGEKIEQNRREKDLWIQTIVL